MQIFFVRHGRSTSNILQTYSGKDVELAPEFLQDLDPTRAYLQSLRFNRVFVSDYKRAIGTAKYLGFSDAEIEPRIHERNFGIFSDLTPSQARSQYPKEYQAFVENPVTYGIPGGESYEDVCQRVWSFLNELTDDEMSASTASDGMRPKPLKEDRILLITHYNVMSAAVGWVMDSYKTIRNVISRNGSILQIQVNGPVKALLFPQPTFIEKESILPQ